MDPVTIGAFVSTAQGIAGEAIVKGTAELAVKDAYVALKSEIAGWISGEDVAALEKAPTSAARQAVIAEAVDALPEASKSAVLPLAQDVADRLKESKVPIGVDISRLTAAQIQLGRISVTEGVGARIADSNITGMVSTGDIVAGTPLENLSGSGVSSCCRDRCPGDRKHDRHSERKSVTQPERRGVAPDRGSAE